MMKDKELLLDALFSGAETARRTELRRALCDPACWIEQIAVAFILVMKCVALTFFCASALLFVIDDRLALALGGVIVLFVLPFNPHGFFLRVLFAERAEKAFNDYLQKNRGSIRG